MIERDGRLSFDALQMRLHPAENRIRKLATETPARLTLFDILLAPDGAVMLREAGYGFFDGVVAKPDPRFIRAGKAGDDQG